MFRAVPQDFSQTLRDVFLFVVIVIGIAHKQGRNSVPGRVLENGFATGLPEMVGGIDADHRQDGGFLRFVFGRRWQQQSPHHFVLAQIQR